MTNHLRLRRTILSLALGITLSLGVVGTSFASGATGGSCGYTTSGQFIGTYCNFGSSSTMPKI
jgi:hypothetical protein